MPLVELLNTVMGRMKWPATYTRYLALGMQLSPALQSPFSFHLGCGYARKNKQKKKKQSKRRIVARLHSAGGHVREELQHTYAGDHPCRPYHPRQVAVSGRSPQHTYTGGNPCRTDRTRQVAVSGRSRDIRAQAVIPAGQTALVRLPCQGGAATHVHRRSSLLARS